VSLGEMMIHAEDLSAAEAAAADTMTLAVTGTGTVDPEMEAAAEAAVAAVIDAGAVMPMGPRTDYPCC